MSPTISARPAHACAIRSSSTTERNWVQFSPNWNLSVACSSGAVMENILSPPLLCKRATALARVRHFQERNHANSLYRFCYRSEPAGAAGDLSQDVNHCVPAQADVDGLCRAQRHQRKRKACRQCLASAICGKSRNNLAANEREIRECKSFSKFGFVFIRAIRGLQVNPNETYSKRKISGQGMSRAKRRMLALARAGTCRWLRVGPL